MTLKYYVPLEDNAEIQIYLFSKTEQYKKLVRTRQVFLMFFLAAFCGLFALLFKSLQAVLLAVVLFFVLMVLVRKRLTKTIYKTLKKTSLKGMQESLKGMEYDGDVIFELGEESLIVYGGDHSISEHYYNLHRVAEENGFIIIYQQDEINAFSVPLSAFDSEEHKESFIKLVEEHIRNAPPKPDTTEDPESFLEEAEVIEPLLDSSEELL